MRGALVPARPGAGPVRLVATDLDGPLLGPAGTVSLRTRRALRAVSGAGVPVVVATGRPPRFVQAAFDSGALDASELHPLVVCANGAMVYDPATRLVVDEQRLAPGVAAGIVDRLRAVAPGVSFGVEYGLAFRREPGFVLEGVPEVGFGPVAHDDAALLGGGAGKLLAVHPELPLDRLHELAAAVVGSDATATHSGAHMVEIGAPGVDKGAALALLSSRLGVPAAATVAFGDMPNDLGMLGWAGHGVAVANAHPSVLDHADEVTATNAEDGVARVLERLAAGRPGTTNHSSRH